MSAGIKSFVSEKQLDEKRKQRQEEWERVRKPEDPVEAPEEEHDPRSLYERLQEQKDKKQEEFEEQLKFKNHFRGINEEESDFLQQVSRRNMEMEKKQREEEKRELDDYRSAVSLARELPNPNKSITEEETEKEVVKKVQTVKKNHQQSILKGAVKRKQQPTENDEEEPSISEEKKSKPDDDQIIKGTVIYPSATKCVGVLPGLSAYSNSDDSDNDSSSDESEVTNNLLSRIVNHNTSD